MLPGKTVAPFDNVNLYPWMAHMLGLNPPKTDGSLNILSGTLRDVAALRPKNREGTRAMSVVLGIDGGGTNTRAAIVAGGKMVWQRAKRIHQETARGR